MRVLISGMAERRKKTRGRSGWTRRVSRNMGGIGEWRLGGGEGNKAREQKERAGEGVWTNGPRRAGG